LSPLQYIKHIPEAGHDALLRINQGDPETLAKFKAASEADANSVLPILGTFKDAIWPVLTHSGVDVNHPAHNSSCCLLHEVVPTCFTVLSLVNHDTLNPDYIGYKQHDDAFPIEACLFGHDFQDVRMRSASRAWEHKKQAVMLAVLGKAVRVQRERNGEISIWVRVDGEPEGKFVFDGGVKAREAWAPAHTLGWCEACNPSPAMLQEQQRNAYVAAVAASDAASSASSPVVSAPAVSAAAPAAAPVPALPLGPVSPSSPPLTPTGTGVNFNFAAAADAAEVQLEAVIADEEEEARLASELTTACLLAETEEELDLESFDAGELTRQEVCARAEKREKKVAAIEEEMLWARGVDDALEHMDREYRAWEAEMEAKPWEEELDGELLAAWRAQL
jgi:hypothetical protein